MKKLDKSTDRPEVGVDQRWGRRLHELATAKGLRSLDVTLSQMPAPETAQNLIKGQTIHSLWGKNGIGKKCQKSVMLKGARQSLYFRDHILL